MSFGGSVGDIFTVGQFAWNVYKACLCTHWSGCFQSAHTYAELILGKGASAEFEELSREVSTLHTAIKELQDEVENEDSILNRAGSTKKKEVEDLVRNCRTGLQQLQRLVMRYKSLGTNQKRTWDRIKFGTEGVQDIREKLTFHTSAIQLFLTTLGTGSLGRIEKKLETIIEEIRSGKREPSILTTLGDDDGEAEVQWDTLKSELVEDGFTKQDIESHKHSIMAHLQQLIDDGELQESVPQTKPHNPNPTSSPKGHGTRTQHSNYQPPKAEKDNLAGDIEEEKFSSGSEASPVSVQSRIAYDNRATPTPGINTPHQGQSPRLVALAGKGCKNLPDHVL